MASLLGPITLTMGQPFKLQVDLTADRLDIENDSPNDVWVFFGNTAPNDPNNQNNTWHRVVRRNHSSVISVEGYRGASRAERSPNAIGAFTGTVWLMAYNAGNIANTGTISGRNVVYVTPLLPGDPAPVHAALATTADMTNQPRIVTIPYAITHWATGQWNGTPNPFQVQQFFIPAALIAAKSLMVYFYGASLAMSAADASAHQAELAVQWQLLDVSNSPVGGAVNLWWTSMGQNASPGLMTNANLLPPHPVVLAYAGDLPANATQGVIQLLRNTGSGTFDYWTAANIDPVNTVPVAEIGQQGLYMMPGGPLF